MYNKSKIGTEFFDVGFLLSLITLIYFPAIVLILFCLYAFTQLRSTVFREVILFFSTFAVTYFLVATAYYWFDKLPEFTKQFSFPTDFSFFRSTFDLIFFIKFLLAFILIIISFVFLNTRYSTVLIQIRKYFSCIIAYGFFILLSAFLTYPFSFQSLYPLVFPASIVVGYFFISLKNREAAEIIHLALLGTVLLFQYINFAE
ncbi:MAG: hypothetical protein ACKVPJ_07885 [Chitinophagales bacterium]